MNEPTLRTERLLLTGFAPADAADVFAYACNPAVSRYTTWSPHRTVADSAAFIDMVLCRGPHEHTWAIRLRDEPPVVGAIEFALAGGDGAEFHYVLAEHLWNRGLMTEAARAVLTWGLEHYPAVRRVATRAMTQNVASHRVMEKCGLRFETTRYDRFAKFPELVEQRQYVLTRGSSPG